MDGITPDAGDRILVKAQADAADNGVYVAATGPGPAPPMPTNLSTSTQGCSVWVREGVRYDDTTWRQTRARASLTPISRCGFARTTIGVFELFATAEQTADLTSSGVYDVEMVAPGGDEVTRVLEGKFRLSKEVTRT